MIPVIPAPFFTYSNKELTFDNSLYILFLFLFSLELFAYEISSLSLFFEVIKILGFSYLSLRSMSHMLTN